VERLPNDAGAFLLGIADDARLVYFDAREATHPQTGHDGVSYPENPPGM
jgi:hypothetical protein